MSILSVHTCCLSKVSQDPWVTREVHALVQNHFSSDHISYHIAQNKFPSGLIIHHIISLLSEQFPIESYHIISLASRAFFSFQMPQNYQISMISSEIHGTYKIRSTSTLTREILSKYHGKSIVNPHTGINK